MWYILKWPCLKLINHWIWKKSGTPRPPRPTQMALCSARTLSSLTEELLELWSGSRTGGICAAEASHFDVERNASRYENREPHSYGHLPVISGYKWDYTFYKCGYKYLSLINGHNCMDVSYKGPQNPMYSECNAEREKPWFGASILRNCNMWGIYLVISGFNAASPWDRWCRSKHRYSRDTNCSIVGFKVSCGYVPKLKYPSGPIACWLGNIIAGQK